MEISSRQMIRRLALSLFNMIFNAIKKTLRNSMRCFNCRRIFIVNCLFFVLNLILCVYNARYSQSPLLYYVSPMDANDRDLLDRTFRTFIEAVEESNLTYFIIGGTLIGSLRHHGPIPWDDDVDVMLSANDMNKLADVLSSFDPNFGLYGMKPSENKFYWKYFPTQGRKLQDYPQYRTPFVDIWFYHENETHIWNSSPGWKPFNTWAKRHVFPLRRRPYGELSLLSPCNGLVVVGSSTNISMCQSPSYNHLLERSIQNSIEISCEHLYHIFPFVKRSSPVNGSSHLVRETLMTGDWLIREIIVDEFC